MIRVKRIYDDPSPEDGLRILVDRLWPRGMTKEEAAIDQWDKEIAPSNELRKWFHAEPRDFKVFESRYREELRAHKQALAEIASLAKDVDVTLLYAAADENRNHASVLKEVLDEQGRK
jgi:uncharacterized protein YeaO (DUF488 family)